MILLNAITCLFIFHCHSSVFATDAESADKSVITASMRIVCEEEKIKDPLSFEAVKLLHKTMDDDSSGSVDVSESTEFAREELHITERDRLDKRKKAFHHTDDEFVTVDDLWCRWVHSEEHGWDTDSVVHWLKDSIELPQYAPSFVSNHVKGSMLPRISAQNSSFLTTRLGVLNPVHRQKIQLKAMDIILFGYRAHKSGLWKDILLLSLLCVALGGYWFAASQRTAAQRESQRLTSQMNKLKDMEHQFSSLQEKLEEERNKNSSTDKKSDSEQIEHLKHQLLNAERVWEKKTPALINLLRKTHDLEIRRINEQKLASLHEMAEARDMVEKYRKKHNTFLSQIRTVHCDDMETIDQRIIYLRQKLEEIAYGVEECQQRWSQIEKLCGFPLVLPPNGAGHHVINNVAGYVRSIGNIPAAFSGFTTESDHGSGSTTESSKSKTDHSTDYAQTVGSNFVPSSAIHEKRIEDIKTGHVEPSRERMFYISEALSSKNRWKSASNISLASDSPINKATHGSSDIHLLKRRKFLFQENQRRSHNALLGVDSRPETNRHSNMMYAFKNEVDDVKKSPLVPPLSRCPTQGSLSAGSNGSSSTTDHKPIGIATESVSDPLTAKKKTLSKLRLFRRKKDEASKSKSTELIT